MMPRRLLSRNAAVGQSGRRAFALIERALLALLVTALTSSAQVPSQIGHQGRLTASDTNYDGPAQFQFALVNSNGTVSFWINIFPARFSRHFAPTSPLPFVCIPCLTDQGLAVSGSAGTGIEMGLAPPHS